MLAVVTLGTFFWMWRDSKPRRRPALLGAPPDPVLRRIPGSNTSGAPVDMSWTNGMRRVPAGTFAMGSPDGPLDEEPVHQVSVDGFWIDATEVTNEQFEKFIRAT